MANSKDELGRVESLMEAANFREALQIINQFDEIEKLSPHERISWHILKSRCLNRLGQHEYALKLTEEVYKESQRLGDPFQILDILIEMAEAFYEDFELEKGASVKKAQGEGIIDIEEKIEEEEKGEEKNLKKKKKL